MRSIVCAVAAAAALVLAAQSVAFAQDGGAGPAFWRSVQARCDATAAKPPSELGRRIARTAIEEFHHFNGHRIDADGRLFYVRLTEAEQGEAHGDRPTERGDLGWWQVMKYWRALYGDDFADKLEVRGYRGASGGGNGGEEVELLRPDAAELLRAIDALADADTREVLREAIFRSAVIDTPWSAAFVSYVVKQAGVSANAFQFSNAHRAYIYDAFATSAAEASKRADGRAYRACPLATTKPREGDLICFQREPTLKEDSDTQVRDRIVAELAGPVEGRSVRRTHCDVVAAIDAPARKIYVIGGNVERSLTVKKLNLRRGLKFSMEQKGSCGGPGHWTLPGSVEQTGAATRKCSLNDRKWFVLLQLR
jgi:hypothetical protein